MGITDPYVTLSEIKAYLGIEDTSRDTQLSAAVLAASRQVDDFTGRRFWLDDTATARIISTHGSTSILADGAWLFVPDIGSTTNLAIEYGRGSDFSAYDSADYETYPYGAPGDGRAIEAFIGVSDWPTGRNRVRVTAKWGWPAVPVAVKQAVFIQSSRLFKRKDSPEGVLGSADWGAIRVGRIDPDVADLIGGFKKGIGG